MKIIMMTIILSISLMLMSGCVAKPTPEQLARADYGEYPTNYERIVKEFMVECLKDPDSAQYKFKAPYKGYVCKPPIQGGGVDKFGWLVDVQVNAKNSYGGYTGYKRYLFIFKGDDYTYVPTFDNN